MDDFLFSGEELENAEESLLGTWKILIVDDEPEIHTVTKLALGDFEFQQRRLEFLHAYSGQQARELLNQHHDIAIVLLDVVMEEDNAGLLVAEYIRNELKNTYVRIILRTGQPGQAPERQVILDYDINDYKSKTELTAQKLFTVVMSGLRSYRDILAIEHSRQGLEKVISASRNMFSMQSMEHFIHGLMQQLTSLLGNVDEAMYATTLVASTDQDSDNKLVVFAGQGEFEQSEGKPIQDVLTAEQLATCESALNQRSIVYKDDYLFAYCSSQYNNSSMLYISGVPDELTDTQQHLIEIFAQNVQIAFENVQLTAEIEDTQEELVWRLSEALEQRSHETGNHVKRVAHVAYQIARAYGLSKGKAQLLRDAAPLHDVGKVAIPDAILNKPSKLNEQEWQVMRQHCVKGHNILSGSKHRVIKAGAIVALEHHEKWDGTGYPHGKKGEDIHIFARIVALADVYDALCHKRCYKDAWNRADILAEMRKLSGSHFEPKIVDAFFERLTAIEAIVAQYPDPE